MSTTTEEAQPLPVAARGLSAALDFAVASHRRAALLLVVFCLLAFMPGFFQIPPVDRDEARFAQATKQMVERGEYVDIRFQDEVRYKKPVGIYWLQAAAVHAGEALGVPHARTTIWLYRLPSLIGATGAVLLTYWAALAFGARRTALLAALMMASSILLGMLLLVSPWFIAIVAKSGATFFVDALGQDMLAKVTSGQETHGAPPGLYFVLFWVTFWPGSVLAAIAAPNIWKARREPGARFLLAWLIPSWIVFEAVMTKLPHYVLPLYPAIAILIAGIIEGGGLSKRPWLVRGTAWWFLFPTIIAVLVPIAFFIFNRDLGLVAWPFAAAAVIFGLFAWWLYDVDGAERAMLRGTLASVFISITVYAVAFPMLPSLFPSALVAAEVRASGCDDPQLASTYAYQEPSLVFLLGTQTRFTDGGGAAEFMNGGPCRFALIDPRSERSFVQRANAVGLRYALRQRIEGFNISNGKHFTMTVFRPAAP